MARERPRTAQCDRAGRAAERAEEYRLKRPALRRARTGGLFISRLTPYSSRTRKEAHRKSFAGRERSSGKGSDAPRHTTQFPLPEDKEAPDRDVQSLDYKSECQTPCPRS